MTNYFYTLGEFAESISVTRQAASKIIKEQNIPHFKTLKKKREDKPQRSKSKKNETPLIAGRAYSIPQSAMRMEALKEHLLPMTISCLNNKGGVGKTSGAINLAVAYTLYGLRVLLVDNDTQGNSSTINDEAYNNNFMDKNITDLLLRFDDLEESGILNEIKKITVNVKHPIITNGKLDLLPNHYVMGEKTEEFVIRAGAENLLDRLLGYVRDDYDIIIIDNSPNLGTMWRMSVMASDALIINITPDKFSTDGLAAVFRSIKRVNGAYKERHKKDICTLGLITSIYYKESIVGRRGVEIASQVLNATNSQTATTYMFLPYITRSVKMQESQYFGGSIFFTEPTSLMAGEYLELATNVYERFIELKTKEN